MKRGQQSIGLVILGVVAIIAVIGLVLLFTRASQNSGALLTDLSIGNNYGTVNPDNAYGIANTYQTATNVMTPQQEYPAPAGYYPNAVATRGTRTPAFIVSGQFAQGGYASIEDLYACETDLTVGSFIGVPHDQFNCYTVPNKGGTGAEVEGFYPRASSAYSRPPQDEGMIGKTGGDMYCYANSLGAEQQKPNSEDMIRENVLSLVDSPSKEVSQDWGETRVNGKRVAVCWVSARNFPFPQ